VRQLRAKALRRRAPRRSAPGGVRAPGARARAPAGRRRRKTGGEVRSWKNVVIKAARREERRRVQTWKELDEGVRRGEGGV